MNAVRVSALCPQHHPRAVAASHRAYQIEAAMMSALALVIADVINTANVLLHATRTGTMIAVADSMTPSDSHPTSTLEARSIRTNGGTITAIIHKRAGITMVGVEGMAMPATRKASLKLRKASLKLRKVFLKLNKPSLRPHKPSTMRPGFIRLHLRLPLRHLCKASTLEHPSCSLHSTSRVVKCPFRRI